MSLKDYIRRKIRYHGNPMHRGNFSHEYCTKCDAILNLQPGYDENLSHWVCRACGTELVNPGRESLVIWYCDRCEACLTDQEGFDEKLPSWKCKECGYDNPLTDSEIYENEEEYEAEKRNPLRGLSDEAVLEIAKYSDLGEFKGRPHIHELLDEATGKYYLRKYYKTYDKSIFEYLMEHPVDHIPRIAGIYEGPFGLVVIEEWVDGIPLDEVLQRMELNESVALGIGMSICEILIKLHNLPCPIIHRDIKPSNVLMGRNGEIYLVDVNISKWYDPNQADDTRYLGTQDYAAPEQVGFGLTASSDKTDIYALGMLMNVLATGEFPKTKKAEEPLWSIVNKCTCLDPAGRYSAEELLEEILRCGENGLVSKTDSINKPE